MNVGTHLIQPDEDMDWTPSQSDDARRASSSWAGVFESFPSTAG